MNNVFLRALQSLAVVDDSTIVEKVLNLFSTISVMSLEETISAYQTFWFFRSGILSLSQVDKERFDRIHRAFIQRMLALCCLPNERSERVRRVELLARIAESCQTGTWGSGTTLYHTLFRKAIDP